MVQKFNTYFFNDPYRLIIEVLSRCLVVKSERPPLELFISFLLQIAYMTRFFGKTLYY
jgi:hypothetical protein